jgi:hypothetical protein
MKLTIGNRQGLQVAAVLVSSIFILGYSLMTSAFVSTSVYFPLVSRLSIVGEDYNLRILISEVMNNPAGHEPGMEWIEIFNRSDKWISLSSHKIGDSETRGDPEGMYHFPTGSIIGPGQVVVCQNTGIGLVVLSI